MGSPRGVCNFVALAFALTLLFLTSITAGQNENPLPPDRLLIGHTDAVMSVAFLPDNVRVVSASHDGTIRIWDSTNGKTLRIIKGHVGPVWSASPSADGKLIASGGADHTVRVWEVDTGAQVGQMEGHTGDVRAAFLPDGNIVSGGLDGLRLWDAKNEKLLWRDGSLEHIDELAISRDGSRCAAHSEMDGQTVIWDLVGRKRIDLPENAPPLSDTFGFSSDGKSYFAPDSLGRAKGYIFETATGKALRELPQRTQSASAIALSSDDQLVAICSGVIDVWDAKDWRLLNSFDPRRMGFIAGRFNFQTMVHSLAFSPDGQRLVAGGGGFLYIDGQWKASKANLITVYTLRPQKPFDGEVAGAAFSRGGRVTRVQIPARLKKKDGEVINLADADFRFRGVKPMDKEADLMWTDRSILLHRQGGELDEIFQSHNPDISGVAWDGKYIWIGGKGALLAIDLSGNTVATITKADTFPLGDQQLLIQPLEPGKLLVVGGHHEVRVSPVDNPSKSERKVIAEAWCSEVSLDGGGASSKLLFTESKMPSGWPDSIFNPQWISEPPSAGGSPRVVYIGAQATRRSTAMIRVDADAPSATVYNIAPAGQEAVGIGAAPIWLDAHNAIIARGAPTRVTFGDTFINAAENKRIGQDVSKYDYVRCDDSIYIPASWWKRIDLSTLAFEELGPAPVVDYNQEDVQTHYFNSGTLGLAAYYEHDRCFFQYTVHPKPVRDSSVTVTLGWKPLPPEGAVEYEGDMIEFLCGAGGVSDNGKAWPGAATTSNYWRLELQDMENQIQKTRWAFQNAALYGVQVTPAQAQAFAAADDPLKHAAKIPTQDLRKLFAEFHAAPEGPEQNKVTQQIMQVARSYSNAQLQQEKEQLASLQKVLTPDQWKQMDVEPLTEVLTGGVDSAGVATSSTHGHLGLWLAVAGIVVVALLIVIVRARGAKANT